MARTVQKIIEEHLGSLIVQNADLVAQLEAATEEIATLKTARAKDSERRG